MAKSGLKPIFIFSLPRSGSTLLQRVLASTGDIATTSEPWLLLPLIYAMKSEGVYAEYWHQYSVRGFEDFFGGTEKGREVYFKELREFALRLYQGKAKGERYFLDKTPRYHLVCEEIIRIFPDAKFIFLWRNPLAVVSSILNSWCGGNWKISMFNVDIYDGLKNLLKVYGNNRENVHGIKYEDLVRTPGEEIEKLCRFLEIDYDSKYISCFDQIEIKGRLGDKTGVLKYHELSEDSSRAWVGSFSTPFRRYWALNYLNSIGQEALAGIGYDFEVLEKDLSEQKGFSLRELVSDPLWYAHTRLRIAFPSLDKPEMNKLKCM